MKHIVDLPYYQRDRRLSVTREGQDAARFEFAPSVQRALRREKRIANRAVRREGKRLVLQFSFEAL